MFSLFNISGINGNLKHRLKKNLKLENDIDIELTPAEVSLLNGKRLLKPVDIFSTIINLLDKNYLSIDDSNLKINLNSEYNISNHEKFVLNFFTLISGSSTSINMAEIKKNLNSRDLTLKEKVKHFFKDWNKTVYDDLFIKGYIKNTIDTKYKIIPILTLITYFFYILLVNNISFSSVFHFILSFGLNISLYLLFIEFTINHYNGIANFKPTPSGKSLLIRLKKISKKYYILKKFIPKDLNISLKNIFFFYSYWFCFEKSFDRNASISNTIISLSTSKKSVLRAKSKDSYVKFSNLVPYLLEMRGETNANLKFIDSKFIIEEEPKDKIMYKNINLDLSSNPFLEKILNMEKKPVFNNMFIRNIFEIVPIIEKIYKK